MDTITITEPVALTCAECGQTGTYVPGARYLAECSNPDCHHEVDARDLQPEDDEIVGFVGGILSVWTVPTDDDDDPEPEPTECPGSGRPVGAASRCETCGTSFGFPHPANLVVGRPAPSHWN